MSSTARVGPSVPRQDRPVREGTRVASIETGLAAAAAKLSQQVRRPTSPTRVSLHCVKLGRPPDTSTTARLCRLPGLGTGRQERGSRFQEGTGEPGTQPHAPYPRQALLTNSMIALSAQDALIECLRGLLPSPRVLALKWYTQAGAGAYLYLLLSSTLMGHLLAELTVGSLCRRLGGRALPATPLCSLPGSVLRPP